MNRIRNLSKVFLLLVATAILFSAGLASAAEELRRGDEIQLDTHHGLEAKRSIRTR